MTRFDTEYILKLENDKIYVGNTNNINKRLKQHFNNEGSKFTKKYKPIEIISINPNKNNKQETRTTLKYMNKYGINNVRGGKFVSSNDYSDNMIKFIEKKINKLKNKDI